MNVSNPEDRARITGLLKACEQWAELASADILIVVALPNGEVGVSLPEDRSRAAQMLEAARLELLNVTGMASRS